MWLDHITPKIFGCRGETHPRGLCDLTDFPGGNRAPEPPDPIPNSEVKWCIADDSVRSPHAKVGHRQGFICNPLALRAKGFFVLRYAGHRSNASMASISFIPAYLIETGVIRLTVNLKVDPSARIKKRACNSGDWMLRPLFTPND